MGETQSHAGTRSVRKSRAAIDVCAGTGRRLAGELSEQAARTADLDVAPLGRQSRHCPAVAAAFRAPACRGCRGVRAFTYARRTDMENVRRQKRRWLDRKSV